MDATLIVALAVGAVVLLAVLLGLRLRRRGERVVDGGGNDPEPRLAVPQTPPAAGPAAVDAAAAPLGSVNLDDLLESRMLRKAVARAFESGEQEQAMRTVMRLTGIGAAEARAFIEKVRQRGLEKD
jgi:hypothetical protein